MHARPTPVLIKPGRICINNICVEEMHLLEGIVVESALCTKFQFLSLLARNDSQLKPWPPANGNPVLGFPPTHTKHSDKLLRHFMKNVTRQAATGVFNKSGQ